jgi:DnaK suppressor protein
MSEMSQELKKKLERDKKILERLLAQNTKKDDDEGFIPPATHGQDDEAERVVDLEMELRTDENIRQRLKDINDALIKIGQGKFGVCEKCHQLINAERLEFIPSARLCVTCQHQQEVQQS